MLKVTGYTPTDIPSPKTPPPKADSNPAQTAKAVAADPGVAVLITSSARSMGKDAVSQAADIDSKKVEAMKASIADGSFTVNAEAIADKLLSNAQEMFRTTLK